MADILDLGIRNDDMVIEDDGIEEDVNIDKLKDKVRRRKGRGFGSEMTKREAIDNFETIDTSAEPDVLDCEAQRSVEGWILMVSRVHEEAQEDDIHGRFSDYGAIKNLHLNLDRRTGFLKGYALVEYERFEDAQSAKTALDGADLLGMKISVDWAFMKKPLKVRRSRRHQ